MSRKLSILIKGKLDVKDLTQEKLDKKKGVNNLKIKLKPSLDLSGDATAKFKKDVEKLAKKTKINLKFDVDKKSVSDVDKTVKDTINKLKKNIRDLELAMKKSGGTGSSKGNNIIDAKSIEDQIQRVNNSLARLKVNKDKVFADARVGNEVTRLKQMEEAFKRGEISAQRYRTQLDTLRTRVAQVSGEFRNASRDGYSFGDMLSLAGKKIAIWGIATSAVYGTFRQIKEGIQYIYELDNSLNEIRIVTNKSQGEVEALADSYNKLGKAMSVTTSELASTSADLYRQGLDDSEVEERMKAIIKYSKISSMELKESNRIITATANATGESVEKIIDIFALLGDTTASGADEIGIALQRVASASENSNISLEKSASWIATISSITRESASVIGRSLNSVISRYESIKKTGFNSEDETKLNDVVKALSDIGINALDSNGQLLDLADVMDVLGGKFEGLEKNEKAYIATTMFGTYQRNRGITLLNDYPQSLKNYENALNSAGSAEEKFAVYQESTKASLDRFKVSIEGLWQAIVGSSAIKATLDSLAYFISAFGNLKTIIATAVLVLGLWKGALVKTIATKIAGTIATANLTVAIRALIGAMSPHPVVAFLAVLTTLVVGMDIYQQKKRANAQESEELVQKLSQEQASLKSLSDEYAELAKAGDLTGESKLRLKAIQNELVKTYGIEAESLDLINGKYEDQIGIINKLSAEKAREQLVAMGTSGEDALANSKKSSSDTIGVVRTWNKELNSIVKSNLGKSVDVVGNRDIYRINGTLEERIEILRKLKTELDEVKNKDDATKQTINEISTEYNRLNKELKVQNSLIGEYTKSTFADDYEEDIKKVLVAKAKLEKDPTNLDAKNDLDALRKSMTSLAESEGMLDYYKEYLDEIFKMRGEDLPEHVDNYSKALKKFQRVVEESSSAISDIQSAFDELESTGSISLDTQIKLAKSHESLIPILGDEKAVHQELTRIVQEEQDKVRQAYKEKLMLSEEFYSKNLEGIDVWLKELGLSREKDLDGAKDLATAKLKVEEALLKSLASSWREYYNIAEGYELSAYTDLDMRMKSYLEEQLGPNDESVIKYHAMKADKEKYDIAIAENSKRLDAIALKGTSGIDFSKIGMGSADKIKKEKESSKNDPDSSLSSYYDSLIKSTRLQSTLTEEKNKTIKADIESAKSISDYNAQLQRTNDLLKGQTLQVTQLEASTKSLQWEYNHQAKRSGFDTSNWFDSSGDATIEFNRKYLASSKETQEQMKSTFDILSKLKKAWIENADEIKTLTDSIAELNIELPQLHFEVVTQQLEKFSSELSEVNTMLELSQARMALLKDTSYEYGREIVTQTNAYKELISIQQQNIEYMQQQLLNDNLSIEAKIELSKSIQEATLSQLKYQKAIKDTTEQLAKDVLEKQKALAQAEIDKEEKALKAYIERKEAKINGIKEEIEALDKKNDLEAESEERAKRLLAIERAQQALAKARNEKNTRVYVDGQGWTWQSNSKDVEDAQNDLKSLQEDYIDWEEEVDLKHKKASLQAEIDYQQKLIDEKEKSFNKQKEIFEEQWENLDVMSEKLLDLYEDNVDNAVESLSAKLVELNNQLAEIANASTSLTDDLARTASKVSSSSSGSSGSSSKSSGSSSSYKDVPGVGRVTEGPGGITIGTKSGSYNEKTGNYTVTNFKTGKVTTGSGSKSDYDKAYAKYHEGGIAGYDSPSIKANEIFAILEKGELILPEKMTENLLKPPNIKSPDFNSLKLANSGLNPISLSIGDIHLSGVSDVNSLSKAIVQKLPNKIIQDLFKK